MARWFVGHPHTLAALAAATLSLMASGCDAPGLRAAPLTKEEAIEQIERQAYGHTIEVDVDSVEPAQYTASPPDGSDDGCTSSWKPDPRAVRGTVMNAWFDEFDEAKIGQEIEILVVPWRIGPVDVGPHFFTLDLAPPEGIDPSTTYLVVDATMNYDEEIITKDEVRAVLDETDHDPDNPLKQTTLDDFADHQQRYETSDGTEVCCVAGPPEKNEDTNEWSCG